MRGAVAGSLLALLLLLVSGATAAPAGASGLNGLQSRLGEAQARLKELVGRRQTQQTAVERLRGQTQGLSTDLGRVEEALFATIERLRQGEADLVRVEQDLQDLEVQIEQKQAAVDARSGVYTTRLRALYKFTRTSPLEQLLAARDFSDALNRVSMMQAVTRVDNLLLGQLRTEQADLFQARATLQRKRVEAVALRDEIDLQQTALAMRRAEQAALVEQARREQGEAEATLTDYDQQARTEQASIASLQAQYQRELEDTARRREEEQRRAAAAAQTATAQAQAQAQARTQAAATATAQAQASQATARASLGAQGTATAGALATVRAQPTATTISVTQGNPTVRAASPTAAAARPAPTATPQPPARPAPTRSGPVTIPGSVSTSALPPSGDGFIWPVPNPVITTEFGERSPFQASHTGLDMAQSLYTPVRAAADGIVIDSGLAVAGKPALSYGMRVSIAHTRGYATLYAHLDDEKFRPTVKAGDRIQRGQLIGYIGMTGMTTGPHLHFEVLVNGEPQNPRNYLPK